MDALSLKLVRKKFLSHLKSNKISITKMADIVHLTDLVKSLIDEVKTLRVENKQLYEEVKSIREEIKPKRRSVSVEKVQCGAIAASSGNRCKCRAKEGKTVCEKHDKPQSSTSNVQPSTKIPKVKKVSKKTKKQIPMHNHPIGEPPSEGVTCELCERHGDIFDPGVADTEFEVVPENGLSIEERLRNMLENEDD
jgi:regulator of replication initiation timing